MDTFDKLVAMRASVAHVREYEGMPAFWSVYFERNASLYSSDESKQALIELVDRSYAAWMKKLNAQAIPMNHAQEVSKMMEERADHTFAGMEWSGRDEAQKRENAIYEPKEYDPT